MAVEYGCFAELAENSIGNSGEMWTRNAISRAYYSMYHSALRVVNGVVPKVDRHGNKINGGSHARFFAYLTSGDASLKHNLDPTKSKKLGLMLKTNHFHRVTADYKLGEKVNRVTALVCLQEVNEIERLVTQLIESKL
ncbi:hypothetical protein [Serratia marcescens]|uniref:hypothetical protein n=1 Tax=Serratia marcescens TaxID=615 RepID=UPI001249CDF7|nr:hypothetical protein [Serratia marcescens]KAB1578765.1 hypothetical protein F7687_22815 [Serratia marcescens]